MTPPPEVLLDRYLKSESRSPNDRTNYRGKQNLEVLEPSRRSLLESIQDSMNEALRLERVNMPGHVAHPRFHFDYIDAVVPNAIAFQSDGYAFIAITLPLIEALWRVCQRLSQSTPVARQLDMAFDSSRQDVLHARQDAVHAHLFSTQLNFVAVHEYTHHVHGHVLQPDDLSEFVSEVLDGPHPGRLEDQAKEFDADGYATNFVLSHMIQDPERRKHGLTLLGCETALDSAADELLLTSFVVAVGGFFYFLPQASFDGRKVYDVSHPPAPARMNNVMHHAADWCKHHRPGLAGWLTPDRYQLLIGPVSDVAARTRDGSNWNIQSAFLGSAEGKRYLTKIYALLEDLTANLPR